MEYNKLSYYFNPKTGRMCFPVQSEIEQIALDGPLHSHYEIYSEVIPFGREFLIWSAIEKAWVIE